jgi:ubiquinone/menaquinone biosynthesis C-methylase UbiE
MSFFDVMKLRRGNQEGINSNKLQYHQRSVFDTSLDSGSVDVVLSNAFLEHLPRIDDAIAEMARITTKGGLGIHNLDAVDHRSYDGQNIHHLAFLEIDTSEEIVHLCNRLRPRQVADSFERHGFDVLEVHPYAKVAVDEKVRRRFADPFRSMPLSDLEVTQARLVVRKR